MGKDICILMENLDAGGVERVFINLAGELAVMGFQVTLLVVKGEGVFSEQIPSNIRLINFDSRALQAFSALVKFLRQEQPQVLITAKGYLNILAFFSLKFSGAHTQLIITLHSYILHSLFSTSKLKKWLIHYLLYFVYAWNKDLAAVSKAVADNITEAFHLPDGKIKVVSNPVIQPKIFKLAKQDGEVVKQDIDDLPMILGVGRLSKEKDFKTLIKAFSLVVKEYPSRLVIVGDGPEKKFLADVISELGLSDSVLLAGKTNNPYAFMAKAEVFVLSSLSEALPTVVIEALALGTKVVATDCGGAREILCDGRLGILCPIADEAALAKAILKAVKQNCVFDRSLLEKYHFDKAAGEYVKLMK